MRRIVVLCVVSNLVAVGCSTTSGGPDRPASQDALSGTEAVTQAAVRGAAVTFVEAYASASQDDGRALRGSVTGPTLRDWVHWLVVQNREFPGAIVGRPSVTGVGAAASVQIEDLPEGSDLLREVILIGQVDFEATPAEGDPLSFSRVLNGPMRLVSDGAGNWRITDFSRDGLPLSAAFQTLDGITIRGGSRVSLVVDSFVAVPAWQFNVIVSVATGPPIALEPAGATLVDRRGDMVARAGEVTASLTAVESGPPAEGIVTFDPRASAAGLFLRLEFGSATSSGPGDVPALEIPLQGVIEPIAIAPAAPSP